MATGDIREIDMTKATDANGKKIRLVGDDGKGYWMEFSDLAAVVGGLLGNKEFALSIGPYGTSGDLNDSTNTGLYVGEIDNPDNISARDTFLFVVFANNICAIQIAYALNSNEVYQRRILKYSNKFYGWMKLIIRRLRNLLIFNDVCINH